MASQYHRPMPKLLIPLFVFSVLASGCATKNYGRQGELTSYERSTMTCREIDLETAKIHGFLARVDRESEFDGRSVLSFLGDFGIGNVMEKNAAVQSANARLSQLQSSRAGLKCGVQAAQPVPMAPPAPMNPAIVLPASLAIPPAKSGATEWPRAQETARAASCNQAPVATLAAKGPGFETYSVPCSNGDVLMVRCEYGNCRAMK